MELGRFSDTRAFLAWTLGTKLEFVNRSSHSSNDCYVLKAQHSAWSLSMGMSWAAGTATSPPAAV